MENSLQKEICLKYKTELVESPANKKVGISLNVKKGINPINGLRHLPTGDTTGWFIWAGETFSAEPDFFVPLHIEHLKDWCPSVLKYLGLPPGYRFLITETGYEDVWQDNSILS